MKTDKKKDFPVTKIRCLSRGTPMKLESEQYSITVRAG
jgi:hypothetical protein